MIRFLVCAFAGTVCCFALESGPAKSFPQGHQDAKAEAHVNEPLVGLGAAQY